MTPAESALRALRFVLGERVATRLRANLPSRKPQLWQQLPRALFRRAELSWRTRFGQRALDRTVVVPLAGFDILMELAPRDRVIDLPLFLFGAYEISGTRFLQAVLKPRMTMIDVGANSGYYSLIAARLVGSQGHVHAFEPVGAPFERLRRNVALNGCQNVTINRAAVASRPSQSIIYPSSVDNNDGLGSLLRGPNRLTVGEEVQVVTLDHLLEKLPDKRVDFLKVDVEGSEREVIAGAGALLSRTDAPVLLFESFDVGPIVESVERFGYEVRHVHYSLAKGLEFPKVGEVFDNVFADYEAPNYVALKCSGPIHSFTDIARRTREQIPWLLRLLAILA